MLAASLLPFLCTGCTMAVHSTVRDQSGKPVQDAVVYAAPDAKRLSPFGGKPRATVVLENFEFKPPVLPVQIGTGVTFLNRDDIRHQIYSISPAKNFELIVNRLSSSAEVVFDKAGVVVVGSGAHDRMVGHIYVLGSRHFATTGADGRAGLEGLPRGAYEVRVWHPGMKASADATAQRVTDSSGRSVGVDFRITVEPGRPAERIPAPASAP